MSVEPIAPADAASLRLDYPIANGLDPGERDLLALASRRSGTFCLATSDKAALVVADAMGLLDRTISLEELVDSVGARPAPPLRTQFTAGRLGTWRASLLLDNLI